MANLNTAVGFTNIGTGRNILQTLAVTTTTETAISVSTDTGTAVAVVSVPLQTGVVGSANGLAPGSNGSILVPPFGAFAQVPNNNSRPYFSSDFFDGRAFKVRIAGKFTSGVAANDLKIGLYLGTSATLGSDSAVTSISSGTSGNFGAVSGNFLLEALLVWDATSGKVGGILENGLINPSGVAGTVSTPVATTQVAAAAASNLNFVASAKWNAANANNKVFVTEFALDLN